MTDSSERKKVLIVDHSLSKCRADLLVTLLSEKLHDVADVSVVASLTCREDDPVDFSKLQSWVNEHADKKLLYNDSMGQKVREKMNKQHFSMKHLRKIK